MIYYTFLKKAISSFQLSIYFFIHSTNQNNYKNHSETNYHHKILLGHRQEDQHDKRDFPPIRGIRHM